MFYSLSENNKPSETKTMIIGKVASNILIWEYMPANSRSVLLVYNNRMQIIKRGTMNVFLSNNIYQLDFINQHDSFAIVAQIFSKHNIYCQVANFNEDGSLLHAVKTIMVVHIPKGYFNIAYKMIASENRQFFALLKNSLLPAENKMALDYTLFDTENGMKAIAQKAIAVPFSKDLNTTLSPFRLDNLGNLYFAQYISQVNTTGSHLVIYKSSPATDGYISSVCNFNNRLLHDINIKLNNLQERCIIYSLWSDAPELGLITNKAKQAGAFSWVVNANLESCKCDTFYTIKSFENGNPSNEYYKRISASDVVPLTDNTYAMVLTDANDLYNSIYGDDDEALVYSYANVQNNSASYFQASNPQLYPAQGSKQHYSFNNNMYRQPATISSDMLLYRIDSRDNSVLWQQAITSSHEDGESLCYLSEYSLLNTGDGLHFICKKIMRKGKESFESITINANGDVSTTPILAHNTNYEILIDKGVQIDCHSMIFPCTFQEDVLAFAKLEWE